MRRSARNSPRRSASDAPPLLRTADARVDPSGSRFRGLLRMTSARLAVFGQYVLELFDCRGFEGRAIGVGGTGDGNLGPRRGINSRDLRVSADGGDFDQNVASAIAAARRH